MIADPAHTMQQDLPRFSRLLQGGSVADFGSVLSTWTVNDLAGLRVETKTFYDVTRAGLNAAAEQRVLHDPESAVLAECVRLEAISEVMRLCSYIEACVDLALAKQQLALTRKGKQA